MADRWPGAGGGVDDLYSDSAALIDAARATLGRSDATNEERARALSAVGRASYYGNRVAESVRLLEEALELTGDAELGVEIMLDLAPALSKEGRPLEALAMLERPSVGAAGAAAGQLHSLRGIILIELGRLTEARQETERAVELLRASGDTTRETRALVNLAVTASMIGDLDESERRYEEALQLTLDTGQPVVAAGIEGNLGYVASRRGDFAAALDWYARARRTFEELGEVDLLAAVLEVDHARTLLDVGLAVDAVQAADRATRSAADGGNQMLELQSRLLCAEALVRLGDHRSAIPEIERGHELAESLDHVASQRRIVYLAGEIGLEVPGVAATGQLDEIVSFVDAGWGPEAYRWMLRRAVALRRSEPDTARAMIEQADLLTASVDVDPVAQAIGSMLVSYIERDREAVDRELDRALAALTEQIDLVGSAEIHSTLSHRIRMMAEIAIDAHLDGEHAAERVLSVLERCRHRTARQRGVHTDDGVDDVERLRDARVRLGEAKSRGTDVDLVAAEVRKIEQDMLRRRRGAASGAAPRLASQQLPMPVPESGTVFLTHVVQGDRLIGVRRDSRGTIWVDHGALDEIASVGRTQRAALRRLNDGRRKNPEADLDRLRSTSSELDERLIAPFDIDHAERVVFTPAAQLWHLCWNALPSLDLRPLTIASTLGDWASDPERLAVRRLAFLGGPDLADADAELAAISTIWGRPDAARPTATAADASEALVRADVAHIAAHGAFRSDNVFFSSIVFADRELSLLEICDLPRVPRMVVLASCDAGASVQPSGLDEDVTVGTAKELLRMGALVVVAPTVAVSDEAAAEFSVSLHRELVAGRSIDDAFFTTKRSMIDSGDPVRMATAWSFNLMGGRSTQQPLRIGR